MTKLHPVVGQSWEFFAIENLLWAVEIKRSLSPKVERGFHAACEDLPVGKFVVYPGLERYCIAPDIEAISLASWQSWWLPSNSASCNLYMMRFRIPLTNL